MTLKRFSLFLCWTRLDGQTCGRERWSPLCMGTGARSRRQSSAQSKMETWAMKERLTSSAKTEGGKPQPHMSQEEKRHSQRKEWWVVRLENDIKSFSRKSLLCLVRLISLSSPTTERMHKDFTPIRRNDLILFKVPYKSHFQILIFHT